MSELSLIAWLRARIRTGGACEVGPGDDAAVLRLEQNSRTVVTTDAFLEGTHFSPDADPRRIGNKVIAASVSDIAAMGCYPLASFVTTGINRRVADDYVRALGESMISAAEKFGAPICGGDVTSWDNPLAITVTVIGETKSLNPVLRSGAVPGDLVFVTGALGGSLLGRHLDLEPRVNEGVFINKSGASAMIDVSDGLSTDLAHLAEESGCGAVIYERAIPVSDAAREASKRDGTAPIEHALNDGEDFELLFTIPPAKATALRRSWQFATALTEIGVMGGTGLHIERSDGRREPLAPRGYEHKWK